MYEFIFLCYEKSIIILISVILAIMVSIEFNWVCYNELNKLGASTKCIEYDKITVREYKGGFNYSFYEIVKVNGAPKYTETNSKE